MSAMGKPRLQSGEQLTWQSRSGNQREHLLLALYISNQGFFSGSVLPAASGAHLQLVCSVLPISAPISVWAAWLEEKLG